LDVPFLAHCRHGPGLVRLMLACVRPSASFSDLFVFRPVLHHGVGMSCLHWHGTSMVAGSIHLPPSRLTPLDGVDLAFGEPPIFPVNFLFDWNVFAYRPGLKIQHIGVRLADPQDSGAPSATAPWGATASPRSAFSSRSHGVQAGCICSEEGAHPEVLDRPRGSPFPPPRIPVSPPSIPRRHVFGSWRGGVPPPPTPPLGLPPFVAHWSNRVGNQPRGRVVHVASQHRTKPRVLRRNGRAWDRKDTSAAPSLVEPGCTW